MTLEEMVSKVFEENTNRMAECLVDLLLKYEDGKMKPREARRFLTRLGKAMDSLESEQNENS